MLTVLQGNIALVYVDICGQWYVDSTLQINVYNVYITRCFPTGPGLGRQVPRWWEWWSSWWMVAAGVFTDAKLKIWSWRSWYVCVMVFQVIPHQSWYGHPSLLLMESIQHRLGCKQNCKRCDELPISTSLQDFWAINSIKFVPYQLIPKWEIRATSHLLQKWCDLHKASGVLTQGRSAPLQTHRVQMPQKLAEEPRLTRKFGWLGDERKSENHEKMENTQYLMCVCVCVDVKKPRACWIGLHFPKFPYCKPQSPFYQTRKRGRTTWTKNRFDQRL